MNRSRCSCEAVGANARDGSLGHFALATLVVFVTRRRRAR
jgi:hypothetical protein